MILLVQPFRLNLGGVENVIAATVPTFLPSSSTLYKGLLLTRVLMRLSYGLLKGGL